jgi:hypothetical protein
MSRGKYSPNLPLKQESDFCFNAKGQIPEEYIRRPDYNEETMADNYDDEGFDRYGYSAYDKGGNYAGIGRGIDRNGYTEFEYLGMREEEFQRFC